MAEIFNEHSSAHQAGEAGGATMSDPKRYREAARLYHGMGFNILPLGDDKAPVLTGGVATNGTPFHFKWEVWKETRQTPAHLKAILHPPYWADVAGVGGICGAVSGGAVCVDFDHTGDDLGDVSAFLAALGLPADYLWTVRSGDGYHVWLRCVDLVLPDDKGKPGDKGKLVKPSKATGQNIEIRYTSHYVALPPTLHPNGRTYAFLHSAPTEPPVTVDAATLLAAYTQITKEPELEQATKGKAGTAPPSFGAPKGEDARQVWAAAALVAEVGAVRGAAQGGRNDALNTAAYNLGQLVGGGHLDRSTVESELMAAALGAGLGEGESSATIRSGLDDGQLQPRRYLGKTAQEGKAASQEEGGGDDPEDRPSVATIEISGQLSTLLDKTLAAVVKRNERNERYPALLKRSGSLVRTVGSGHDTVIEPVVENAALAVLARSAKWVITRQSKEGDFLDDTFPPSAVVKAFTHEGEWDGLPELEGVVTGPVFAPDGSLHSAPGYDKGTRLFLAERVDIGDTAPTVTNIAHAKQLILGELLGQFPFVDDASRAHAVALLLAPFVRAMIEGPTPLHIVSAPAAGSGKGLLTQSCLLPALGRSPEAQGEATNPAEWQKLLTSILLKGRPIVYLDNVHGALTAAALATALTEASWTDRLLGASRQVTIPIRTTWCVTANNPALTQEMARRSVLIRLDSNTARPWERSGFKHNPVHFATQHRSELVTAAITLVNGWLAAGRPKWEGKTKGSYGEWCNVIGGILATANIGGFLANDESLFAAAIDQGEHFQAFIEAWLTEYGTAEVTARQLFAIASEPDTPPAIPPSHLTNLLEALLGDKNERSRQIKLGNLLVKHRGVVFTVNNEPYKLRAGKLDGLSPIRGEPRYQLKAIRLEGVVNVDQHSPQGSPPTQEELHEWEAMKNSESGECGECGECDHIQRPCAGARNAHTRADAPTHAHVRVDKIDSPHSPHSPPTRLNAVVNVDQHSPLPDEFLQLDKYIGRSLPTAEFLEANKLIHRYNAALTAHGLTITKQRGGDGQWTLAVDPLSLGAQEGRGAASQAGSSGDGRNTDEKR